MEDEKQTCPRRAEGPGYAEVDADSWNFRNWKFTNADDAKRFNDDEARKKNEEYARQGNKSVSHSNERYWLWPGPGPMPRNCSYCGSVHPADAIRLVKEFKFEIGATTKGYKLYLEPPGYSAQMAGLSARLRAGEDPFQVASGTEKVHSIAPPLKVYSPHFTPEQWRELLA